jgi:putative ATP-binding cassette transporter
MKLAFIRHLRKESGAIGIKTLIAAVASGLFQGATIGVINSAAENVEEGGLNFRYFALFILCISAFIVMKKYALSNTIAIVQKIITDVRIRISDKIRRSSLIKFEQMGKTQIYTIFTSNTESLLDASRSIGEAGPSLIMTVFCFTYIAFISTRAFLLIAAMTACAVFLYLISHKSVMADLHESIVKETQFFEALNQLLNGFKEVKINEKKSQDLYENHIRKMAVESQELKGRTETRFVGNFIFAYAFFYILVAAIVFILPQISAISSHEVISLVSIVLFVSGPLSMVVGALPSLAKANVAIEKLRELEEYLDAADDSRFTASRSPIGRKRPFEKIVLSQASFTYSDEKGLRIFSMGPINLTVNRGEILFLSGGNGSGKSTLLRVLTGLYYPESGEVYYDSIRVDETNYAHYRNLFSVIFTDFHLFDRLYGLENVDEETIYDLLDSMQLNGKTDFADGRFTNTNLSTGQRKRLAMITSCLEDKPIFVFDEVAADQDPIYREYFYTTFLAELKSKGKTVIAATHDDRYFHIADRLIKMECGKIVSIE